MAACPSGATETMVEDVALPRPPAYRPPARSCNAHCHVFGPFDRFPLPEDRSFEPPLAPETALRRVDDRLGFERAVLVQSQGHGFDHRAVLAALEAGAGRYRGVALIRAQTPEDELKRLHAAGFCGARFSFMPHLGFPDLDAVRAVIARVHPLGWHVAIHVAGEGIVEREGFIRSIEAPVVIDHMGRPDLRAGPDSPAITALCRLLDTGRVWVKLSGADRLAEQRAPYAEALPIARRLAEHAPERILWGTDWPHVNLHGPMTDDAELVDLIPQIAPTEALQRRMLVDNPAEFFGFPELGPC